MLWLEGISPLVPYTKLQTAKKMSNTEKLSTGSRSGCGYVQTPQLESPHLGSTKCCQNRLEEQGILHLKEKWALK